MTARIDPTLQTHSIREVLAAGWRLFRDGFVGAFPWVLAAELLTIFPLRGQTQGGLDLNADMSTYFQPGYFGRELLMGLLQALLYAIAILRLAESAGQRAEGNTAWVALRSVPSLFIGYMVYSMLVIFGMGLGLIVFLNMLPLGLAPAIAFAFIPLAPTAIASTALALFAYPAVLERRGPFAALGESVRLAKSSWVRVTTVISVPALVMLCEWAANNGAEVRKLVTTVYGVLMQAAETGVSQGNLQQTMESALHATGAGQSMVWQVLGVVLTAVVWWYAVAVCYAQYRDLKQSNPN